MYRKVTVRIKTCVVRTWGVKREGRCVTSKFRRPVTVKVAVEDSKRCKTAAEYEK